MTYRVIFAQSVVDDIENQIQYLQKEGVSSQRITKWFNKLFKQINTLKNFPHRHPISEPESEARGLEIRKMVYEDYLVFYRVNNVKHTIEVLAFRHSARQLPITRQQTPE